MQIPICGFLDTIYLQQDYYPLDHNIVKLNTDICNSVNY